MKKYKQVIVYDTNCDLPIYDEVDVLVAGGGPAGIAAAETAARHNNKTLLIERLGFLGGAAVAGYSGTICGMYYGCENPTEEEPKQAVFGWTNKFYQAMKKRNGVTRPQPYGKTFLVPHDPQVFKEVSEDMVLDSGAKILYHSTIVGVIKENDEFKGVVIDTKSGLAQIRSKVIIDATGDADIIYRAGYDYTMGDNGVIQNPTMIFRLGGVDVKKFFDYWGEDRISPDKVTQAMKKANEKGANLPRLKVWVYDTTRPNELFMNVTLITGKDGRALNVCDPDDHTEAEEIARKQVREYAKFFKENIPGCELSFVNDLSCEVGVRQTRSIVGIDKICNDDVANARKRSDGIVACPWPIELHNGEAPYLFWLINDYYEIPFGALVPKVGENLIVAGRNLCADHHALASCRVVAQCFGYGHAAGFAANKVVKENIKFRDIKGEDIRKLLNSEDTRLD
ncbi:FAD-dependent oxidoreductase [Clostridium oceanicum]|uniref:FAD-dependent oxidoreductase n=1 Tax=Clostridium oceanicum TaxID=1543 RepID=A0ABP3UUF9_9CLOT